MALRIDHLNKKLASFGVTLTREDDVYILEHVEGESQEVEGVEKINDWTEAEWLAAAEEFSAEQVIEAEEEFEDDEEENNTMSQTLMRYRTNYVGAVSYTQGATLDNGDELAQTLRGLSPEQVCKIADGVFGEPAGTHFARWEHLNVGQRRMNAGNRLRAAAKKNAEVMVTVRGLVAGS